MSGVLFVLILALAAAALFALVVLVIDIALVIERRRRRRNRGLTEREIADALGTFGVDISIWPSRAPKNGSAEDHVR